MWLISEEYLNRLQAAYDSVTPDQMASLEASFHGESRINVVNGERILQINGSHATLNIHGVLTREFDLWAYFSGGNTSYTEIINAVKTIQASDNVTAVDIIFNTPGGHVNGIHSAVTALKGLRDTHTTRAIVDEMAASCGYALASQCGQIVAANPMAIVGSVGVVRTVFTGKGSMVDITSTNAPNKRPDASTEEGRAVIRQHLDEMHDEFVALIATGRGTTSAIVNANFGRGAPVLAKTALAAQMIDAMLETHNQTVQTNTHAGDTAMNEDELKVKHPELYASLITRGATAERIRCESHLKLAAEAGDVTIALDAIKEGKTVGDVQGDYLLAMMRKLEGKGRVTQPAPEGTEKPTPPPEEEVDPLTAAAQAEEAKRAKFHEEVYRAAGMKIETVTA